MQNEPKATAEDLNLSVQERDYIVYYVEDRIPRIAERLRDYSTELELTLQELKTLMTVFRQNADRQYTTYDTADTQLVVAHAGLSTKLYFRAERDHIREIGIENFLDGAPTSREPRGSIPDKRKEAAQIALGSYDNTRDGLIQDAGECGIN